jgi:ABC-2 type transport system permease protein
VLRPYRAVLSARFRALLQYRGAAIAGFGTQLFWGLIRMMIFTAFYAGAAGSLPMTRENVVAYIWLGQAFLGLLVFGADREIVEMIRTGNVAYELLRPVDLYGLWLGRELASRIVPTALRATPLLVIASLAGWIHWPGPARVGAFAAVLVGAVLLSATLITLINITTFWTVSGQGISTLDRKSTRLNSSHH